MLVNAAHDGLEILANLSVCGGFISRNHRGVVLDVERKECREPLLD